ncbi:MAG: hypothetical protein ACR2G5_00790 [Pyrinomonadaceae bacterium]
MIRISRTLRPKTLLLFTAVLSAITISSAVAEAQKNRSGGGSVEETPIFQEYRSVRIGMPVEEVRKKLNNPSDKSDEQDFFVFGDNETAQVFYDKTHKVFAISVNFLKDARDLPTPKGILGSEVAAKPDGSAYKMVRYPKAGYWVSYSRTSGESPLTIVTLQKID